MSVEHAAQVAKRCADAKKQIRATLRALKADLRDYGLRLTAVDVHLRSPIDVEITVED
jgi:hypothetical protein